MFDSSPNEVFLIDYQGNMLFYNARAEKRLADFDADA